MQDDDQRPSFLWQYAHQPYRVVPKKRSRFAPKHLQAPYEFAAHEYLPLRVDREWHPQYALDRLGRAYAEGEFLPRVLVASFILDGAPRIASVARRLELIAKKALGVLEAATADRNFQRQKEFLDELVLIARGSIAALPKIQARAKNDTAPVRPGGLRSLDLRALVHSTQGLLVAQEMINRMSVASVKRGIYFFGHPPSLIDAENARARLAGGQAPLHHRLYWPPEYARVVVVYEDGRLAYDPRDQPEPGS